MKTKLILPIALTIASFAISTLSSEIKAQTSDSKESMTGKIPAAEERAKMLTDKMKETLMLDDMQYKSVYDLNLDYAEKNEMLLTNQDISRSSKFKKLKFMQEARDEELKSILNKDQYSKYREIVEEQKAKMKEYAKSKRMAE